MVRRCINLTKCHSPTGLYLKPLLLVRRSIEILSSARIASVQSPSTSSGKDTRRGRNRNSRHGLELSSISLPLLNKVDSKTQQQEFFGDAVAPSAGNANKI